MPADGADATAAQAPASAPTARLVIALDGPGSSGKSSVGAAVAARLGLRFCDTGLLYRALTHAAIDRGVPASDPEALVALVPAVRLEPDAAGRYATVTLDGRDVTADVQGALIDEQVSSYARVPELRAALLARQREMAAAGGIVMAGRDIGTVVLPDASIKLFLDASVEERAARRAAERGLEPDDPEARAILDQLRARDERDRTRPVAPLRAASDAIVVRTDGNTFEATVDAVVEAIVGVSPGTANPPRSRDAAPANRSRARRGIAQTPIATRLTFVIRAGSFVMRWLVRLFTRVRFVGDFDAIPRTGAVIVVANHASNADPVIVGAFLNQRLGRPLNWMGKREVFEWPVISWLARHGGVHPVDRGAADVEAFRTAMRILEAGHILAVFPEGTRSPDGRLQAARDGTAVLAARSGATIVPIGIGNSDRLWPKGRLLPRFTPEVFVTIGTPFRLGDPAPTSTVGAPAGTAAAPAVARHDRAAGRRAKSADTERIMRAIAALLPERQRGAYGDAPASEPAAQAPPPA